MKRRKSKVNVRARPVQFDKKAQLRAGYCRAVEQRESWRMYLDQSWIDSQLQGIDRRLSKLRHEQDNLLDLRSRILENVKAAPKRIQELTREIEQTNSSIARIQFAEPRLRKLQEVLQLATELQEQIETHRTRGETVD